MRPAAGPLGVWAVSSSMGPVGAASMKGKMAAAEAREAARVEIEGSACSRPMKPKRMQRNAVITEPPVWHLDESGVCGMRVSTPEVKLTVVTLTKVYQRHAGSESMSSEMRREPYLPGE